MKNTFFTRRHTVRQYSPRQLDDTELKEMLEEASHAPNTGNMQWYSVIVTRDAEQKKALAPAHFNQPQVENAAVVLTFCLDLLRFEDWCRLSNAEPGFENFQSFVAAIIDTSIFAQQFCTAAEMRGWGTCYLGTTTYNAPDISRVLGLPERVVPVTTITVGWPLNNDGKATWRLPVEAIVHNEKYSRAPESSICKWYEPLEAESRHYIEENEKEFLAQVFTDIRYPRQSAEYFSKIYYDFLTKNRFL